MRTAWRRVEDYGGSGQQSRERGLNEKLKWNTINKISTPQLQEDGIAEENFTGIVVKTFVSIGVLLINLITTRAKNVCDERYCSSLRL
jgi:hypothetical protein